jgi:hypothetical protein
LTKQSLESHENILFISKQQPFHQTMNIKTIDIFIEPGNNLSN